ncbi:MAG: hypothetical protein KKD38_09215, partial [Candidatus Delongbacteria bacterium]|nr:hypothetical protein [Candidatus Delongbacteria bacterium]
IRNNSYNALDEGALFYIENEGEKLPKGSIISKMIRNRKIEGEDKIVGKQMEYDDTYGYSIKLSSAVPPDCEFILVMLFDESKLEGIDPRNLKIKKIYRKYEKLSKLLSSDSKITLTYLQLSIIVSLFGLVWLGVNIIRKRYSTGMEIIDQILYFIFKKRIFLKNKEKNEL